MEQAGNAGAGTQRVRKATGRFKASSGRGGKLAKEKEEASGVMSGAFLLGGMVRRGASDRKNPLPVTTFQRGHNTCAVWTPSHMARLRAGRRLHRSAPHGKGYCYTDRPISKPCTSHLLLICIYVSQAPCCQEAQPDRQTAGQTPFGRSPWYGSLVDVAPLTCLHEQALFPLAGP